jgi:hypothetical protein
MTTHFVIPGNEQSALPIIGVYVNFNPLRLIMPGKGQRCEAATGSLAGILGAARRDTGLRGMQ